MFPNLRSGAGVLSSSQLSDSESAMVMRLVGGVGTRACKIHELGFRCMCRYSRPEIGVTEVRVSIDLEGGCACDCEGENVSGSVLASANSSHTSSGTSA